MKNQPVVNLPVGLSKAPVKIIEGDTVFFGETPPTLEKLEARMAQVRKDMKKEARLKPKG